jgi:hypothetical protein
LAGDHQAVLEIRNDGFDPVVDVLPTATATVPGLPCGQARANNLGGSPPGVSVARPDAVVLSNGGTERSPDKHPRIEGAPGSP